MTTLGPKDNGMTEPGTPGGGTARPPSAVAAWSVVGCGLVALVLYAVGPAALRMPLSLLISLGAIAGAVAGTLRQPNRAHRRAWWAIVASLSCFLGASVLRLVIPGAAVSTDLGPATFIPDLLVVPGYLMTGYALLHMLGRRKAAADDPARADALLVGLGAALATWAFLIAPHFQGSDLPPTVVLLNALFPMADVLLLVIVSRLVLADGIRQPSLWLLGASMCGLFVGDLLFSLQADRSGTSSSTQLAMDLAFLTGFVAMSGAVLHPTMRTLTQPQTVQVGHLGVLRGAAIAVVLSVPMVVATLWPATTVWNGLVRLLIYTLLAITLLTRIVSNNNSRSRAEQVARGAADEARHRATHDTLTELPNRELLTDTVTQWCDRSSAEGQEISLLFLDLDRFKLINDSWGHRVGDELLCAVASRLSAIVRGEDLVCRIGGDEFVVALASPSHSAMAEGLARRILAEFAEPFQLSVGQVTVTPSIGLARSEGTPHALELIRDADTAMYKAKAAGRNSYATFDTSLRAQVQKRADLEQSLRGALTRGELAVHYQPIIDLRNDELAGFEALMRWNHPELGSVSPLDFIPIAEDTGLIVPAGAWLLEQAAEQLARWRSQRPPDAPPLHMSVNISVRQLRDVNLVDVVSGALERTGLPASALWLEITESGVIEDPEYSLAILRHLRRLGVTICLDDFGTGYSSLTYLKRFPTRIVKIDRSFVNGVGNDQDDETIVRTVVAMAHALGQQVVAEGVETAVQRDWLRNLGCEMVQGWLYGAARPADASGSWIGYPLPILQSTPAVAATAATQSPSAVAGGRG
ncbi:MAG TPA: EAL domain-containing protein [Catenuloplanes sp.]|jgi:diguanylate cyclase (GGDEF)-like protein